jgi:hypothetical protein
MEGYKIKGHVYNGPYDFELNVAENAFSLEDVLHPDIIRLIPKEYNLTQKLTKFHYTCDCQCFFMFRSEDKNTSLFIYADTNEWEAFYIRLNENTKLCLEFRNTNTLVEKKIYDCEDSKHNHDKTVLDITDNPNINMIDWKWLEDIAMWY